MYSYVNGLKYYYYHYCFTMNSSASQISDIKSINP